MLVQQNVLLLSYLWVLFEWEIVSYWKKVVSASAYFEGCIGPYLLFLGYVSFSFVFGAPELQKVDFVLCCVDKL